ncbi:hypothetical protein B566_EDAN004654 [Ephemera danica]|nr:hypothetical protein B566_EDAN004654 [Ephemera danica]
MIENRMRKQSRREAGVEDGAAGCSSTSNSGSLHRRLQFPRLSLQRLLMPLMPHRNPSSRSHPSRRAQALAAREMASKGTSTVEVGIEALPSTPLEPPPLQRQPRAQPSPATSASSSPEPPAAPVTVETPAIPPPGERECPLCLAELPDQCFPALTTCDHRSCYDCLQTYLRVEISESRTSIACPQCSERLHPNDVRMILNDKTVYSKYEDFMVRRVLAVDPDTRWCPQPDCGFAVIATGCASCPKLRCLRPGCPGLFCYHCKAEWHPNQTCDAARMQRRPLPPVPNGEQAGASSAPQSLSASSTLSRDSGIKPCPRCSVFIVKMDDGSCNHMTCAVCGAEFCWLCMKEISDLHYLSPSGCTFWGKKPWSRKKKILWQLGTLVGAPVGIALVAGIALPAMLIGIPVWVGRKLYARYQFDNKHKRNVVLVSPLVAGLVVSIGVPILLFYIYGVVPVSLCRSGGCDVSTSASGFHFDFDDEPEGDGDNDSEHAMRDEASGRQPSTTSADLATDAAGTPPGSLRRGGTNPSIGEASLSMDSGSHAGDDLQRRVRLEVQAEVTRRPSRHSSGGEQDGDDGSTRALAGSMLSYKAPPEEQSPPPRSVGRALRNLLLLGSAERLPDCEAPQL